jgi:hypothetical protein
MSRVGVRPEIAKLARALELDPAALSFLSETPAADLRAFRVAFYERLFHEDEVASRRLAAMAERLPTAIAVRVAQMLGPVVTARVAADMRWTRALEMTSRLPPVFLADVCEHLDPRRTRDVVTRLPADLLIPVARELVARGDHMTMSRFVDFVPDATVAAIEDAIADEGALLLVAFYMGSKNGVDRLFRRLSSERLARLLVRVQERPDELLPPFLALLVHVSYKLKRELGDLAASQDEAIVSGLMRATQQLGLWGDVLGVVAAMSEDSQRRVANLPALAEEGVQASIIHAADERELWGVVLGLVALMEDANRNAVAAELSLAPRTSLARATDAALTGERWDVLLDLVRRLDPDSQRDFAEVAEVLGDVDPELLGRIAERARRHGLAVAVTTSGSARSH